MNFSSLTNQSFTQKFKLITYQERKITAEVLLYFKEAEKRMLYAELGYSSLLAFAVKELKYSEAAAYRRITAMRLMKDIPEVKDKIESGSLSLSNLTMAASFVKQSEKQASERVSVDGKREILHALENQSTRQAERTLLSINPAIKPEVREKQRAWGNGATQVTTTLDAELVTQLQEIQILLGKKMQVKELLKYLAAKELESLKKKSLKDLNQVLITGLNEGSINGLNQVSIQDFSDVSTKETNHASANGLNQVSKKQRDAKAASELNTHLPLKQRSRPFISVKVKRTVFNKALYRCCYIDPVTQRQCEERHHLEIEHITPKAFGGSDDVENLEVLCSAHNKFRALQKFGSFKMREFMPSLK